MKLGAIAGMTSVILMSLLGQPRIFLAMADDGLLPPGMRKVHPKYRTPHVATAITTVLAAVIAGLFPLNILGELISMGILLAFTGVCIGVLVLRYTRPNLQRPFRVPFAPVTCVLGALICGGITYFLPRGNLAAVPDLVDHRLLDLRALRLPQQPHARRGQVDRRLKAPERPDRAVGRVSTRLPCPIYLQRGNTMRPKPVPTTSASGYDLRPLSDGPARTSSRRSSRPRSAA